MPLCITYIKSKKPKTVKCTGFILTICAGYWKEKKERLKEILEEKVERKLKTETAEKCCCFSFLINLKNRQSKT